MIKRITVKEGHDETGKLNAWFESKEPLNVKNKTSVEISDKLQQSEVLVNRVNDLAKITTKYYAIIYDISLFLSCALEKDFFVNKDEFDKLMEALEEIKNTTITRSLL